MRNELLHEVAHLPALLDEPGFGGAVKLAGNICRQLDKAGILAFGQVFRWLRY
jgi:hypothetical protein